MRKLDDIISEITLPIRGRIIPTRRCEFGDIEHFIDLIRARVPEGDVNILLHTENYFKVVWDRNGDVEDKSKEAVSEYMIPHREVVDVRTVNMHDGLYPLNAAYFSNQHFVRINYQGEATKEPVRKSPVITEEEHRDIRDLCDILSKHSCMLFEIFLPVDVSYVIENGLVRFTVKDADCNPGAFELTEQSASIATVQATLTHFRSRIKKGELS